MKKSVKPKNTDKTIKECSYPGARELAGPAHKSDTEDLKMSVDSSKESRISANGTKQIGGHARKK